MVLHHKGFHSLSRRLHQTMWKGLYVEILRLMNTVRSLQCSVNLGRRGGTANRRACSLRH